MSGKITWGVLGKRKEYYKVGFQESPAELTQEEREALVRQQLSGNSWKYEPEKLKPGFGWMGANEKGAATPTPITPTPTPTNTLTPTPTQTNTPTPSATCPITTQYLEVQLSENTKFKLILWNQSDFTSPATANCDYVISGTAYGDLGTTYTGTETIFAGQHQHQFDLAPVLQPGEIVIGFDVWSYTASTCVCPVNLVLPISTTPTPTPTITPTNTQTPTITPTNTGTPTPTPTPTSVWATLSGGTETTFVSGSTTWKVHTFTATTQVSVVSPGLVNYMIIAGGGGGGFAESDVSAAGGGGAGGYLESSTTLSGGTHTITIGAGGADSVSGNTTSFYGFNATGGGRGGIFYTLNTAVAVGGNGGSGGGGTGVGGSTNAGGTGVAGQGFSGGTSSTGQRGPGGGGGASESGDNGLFSGAGAIGGDGKQSQINGTLTNRAGGGGAGAAKFTTNGAGGLGGGGNGGACNSNGSPGSVNTGGGGGGGASGCELAVGYKAGGAGGSGIVILAYQI